MIASKEKAKISFESHMRVYTHFGGQGSEAKFRGTLKEVCEEVYNKLPQHFHRHQRKFR